MYDHVNPKNGERAPLVADDIYQIVSEVRFLFICFFLLLRDQGRKKRPSFFHSKKKKPTTPPPRSKN